MSNYRNTRDPRDIFNNVTSDIDSFTDEPVVQYDVCRKYFLR